MNIGIDLDGVVYNSENWMMSMAEIVLGHGCGIKIADKSTNDIKLRYNLSDEQALLFRKKYCPLQIKESPLMPLARECMEKLKENGNNLIIITGRGAVNKEDKALTEERLKRDAIPYDKLIFSDGGKLSSCIKEKIDIMIDDSYPVINQLAENNIKCLQLCDTTLRKSRHKNAKSVYNWGEILQEIIK